MQTKIEEYIIGIDPGVLGGYCILDEKGAIYQIAVMPGDMAELKQIAVWAEHPSRKVTVVIEDVTPNPNWKMNSCWKFAQHVGQLHLIFPNAKRVYPRTWQAAMGCKAFKGDAKAKSLQVALMHVHETAFIMPRKRVPHNGLVDAYLIAKYYFLNRKFLEK